MQQSNRVGMVTNLTTTQSSELLEEKSLGVSECSKVENDLPLEVILQTEQYEEKEKNLEIKKNFLQEKFDWFHNLCVFLKKDIIIGISNEARKYITLVRNYACVCPEFFYPIYEPLQVTLSRCLLIESCIESLYNGIECDALIEIFSPKLSDIKFIEVENIVGKLVFCDPFVTPFCILYIRIQIYKARFIFKTDKIQAEEILYNCIKQFEIHKGMDNHFLRSYGMIFVELCIITKEERFLKDALKYLTNSPHFTAVAIWRCSLELNDSELAFKAQSKFSSWKEEHWNSQCKFLCGNLESLDDETAEIIFSLARIQWGIFATKAIFEKDTSMDDWLEDFPKDSLFTKRLQVFKNQFSLNYNCEVTWDDCDESISNWK